MMRNKPLQFEDPEICWVVLNGASLSDTISQFSHLPYGENNTHHTELHGISER